MDVSRTEKKSNPLSSANLLSKVFFCCLNPLFRIGAKRTLEEDDMYRVLPEDESERLGEELQRCWDREVQQAAKDLRSPKLCKVLMKCYWRSYSVYGIFTFIEEVIKVIQPLLLGKLIRYFEGYSPGISLYEAYVCALGISLTTMGLVLLLRAESWHEDPGGHVSHDLPQGEVTIFLHYVWVGPVQAAGVTVLLWWEIGASCLAGMAVLFLMIPVQVLFGHLFSTFRAKTVRHTDNRIRMMNEVVSGIRIIKMYAWEKPFSALFNEVRRIEISDIMKSSYLRGLNMAAFFVAGKVVVFITLSVYALTGEPLTPSRVFVTISLYGVVRLTVTLFFPSAIEKVSETLISMKRIKVPSQELEIWKRFYLIYRCTASLSSSLLSTILGELPQEMGVVKVKGELTYFNAQKYEQVLHACSLKRDMELLPDGDLRVIGDQGSNLSGGQKARVNLARDQDGDIYLLDDPLSAVDAEVGKHLFEKCICGLLRKKPRILVTHQLQYLQAADRILVLNEVLVIVDDTFRAVLQCFTMTFTSLSLPKSEHAVAVECHPEGTIPVSLYMKYFRARAGVSLLLGLTVLNVLAQVSSVRQTLTILKSAVIFGFLRSLVLFNVLVNSAQTLHNRMFQGVLRSPIGFFDVNPVGEPSNFSKDVGHLDSVLPWTFVDFIQVCLQILGVIIVAAVVMPWILIPTIPLFVIFLFLRHYFLQTSRDIKRLESTTRSPIIYHLSCSLQGLWTIRAVKAQLRFQRMFDALQNLHSEAWFLFLTTSRWFAVRLDALCSIFITLYFCFAFIDLEAGGVGLALCYAVTLVGMFQWGVRQSSEVENMMTSVERVVEYADLRSEAPWELHRRLPPDWPGRGCITFDQMSFSYCAEGPMVLKNINAIIILYYTAKCNVGIVGRTGAGKSSLLSALIRLAEPEGRVSIDGVLTSEIGLHTLRQKISIIPQDPVLFTGSMRANLDPFSQHTDEDLWNALQEVQLKGVVEEMPRKMETELAEAGSNFSLGQRQLVCLARAILRRNRVLVIDEATANVDPGTDELIQKNIREKFKDCTVLTIAHRLNTVIDSDRIMVLDAGRIREYDEPYVLLLDRRGMFYSMVEQAGEGEAAALFQTAKQVTPADTILQLQTGFL
uniref:ATP-binding cassette, sub-family C (CFTR/MRP), member 4 n=1 Tax=Denticeps clupeoides TaxID=299321 RepID=A0AAY4DHT8_9TELE